MKKQKSLKYVLIKRVSLFLFFSAISSLNSSIIAKEKNDVKKKILYLTFDDGPTKIITEEILDILKEKKVVATFFVVGEEIDNHPEILKRIVDEGHKLGLHSDTHDFRYIYEDSDNFMSEMKIVKDKIKKLTNLDVNILRFPGGSAGKLSQDFLAKIHRENYKIFDWNVDIKDGVDPYQDTDSILNNSKISNTDMNNKILLAHCNSNNRSTVKALPLIIDYYSDMGYVFEGLTFDVSEYFFKIRKKNA